MDYSRNGVAGLELTGDRLVSDRPDRPKRFNFKAAAGMGLSLRKVSWRAALAVEFPVLVFLAVVLYLSVALTPALKLNVYGHAFPLVSLSWFHDITGIPDLFCGMTRSFVALGHLNLKQALVFHPLGPALYILWIGVTAVLSVAFITRRRFIFSVDRDLKRRIIMAVFGLLTVAWVVKLIVWSQVGLL